ncbi:hypothetical protein ACHAW5_004722 [Stephanodiscus triporus]|uniref:Uncharacterized protein n=1 Tax=Stephanodiscus triporus TaxID=2934178 RepID=A0ABD3PGW5_9STRA
MVIHTLPPSLLNRVIMKPIIRASIRINSFGLFIRPYHVCVPATSLCKLAAMKNHGRYSYPSNTQSMIISSYVGGREVIYNPIPRRLFSSAIKMPDLSPEPRKRGRRVWRSQQETMGGGEGRGTNDGDGATGEPRVNNGFWGVAVDDAHDFRESLTRICEQERQGGRMKQSQLGVLREDPHDDIRVLLENYTASALASALREREDTLQHCATLLATNQLDELSKILGSYDQRHIIQRRHTKEKILDFSQGGFDQHDIELLRKGLNRMPRRVSTAHSKRAGVVLPLCNVDGVPCILFEKRSARLRAHPDEVMFQN